MHGVHCMQRTTLYQILETMVEARTKVNVQKDLNSCIKIKYHVRTVRIYNESVEFEGQVYAFACCHNVNILVRKISFAKYGWLR